MDAKLFQSCHCEPLDWRPPGFSAHAILQARILEWVAMPSSRGSSQLRDWIQVYCNKLSYPFFCFPVLVKLIFTLHCSLFSVLYILSKKCTYFNLKVFYCWKMLAVIWQPRVATNPHFAKTAASAKHNKMISACTCVCIY